MSPPKRVLSIHHSDEVHWVGDGFPVRTLFAYPELGARLSPFLLLDYAGPRNFPPTDKRRGVGGHPHRGFETVTLVYHGEVEHRDSSGAGGKIGPGDVQWMTAASGVVHEEFHGRAYAKRGGAFEMVQLWVNLPAKDKMARPRYQEILAAQIPSVDLGAGRGVLRVIAGEHEGTRGPAKTFTPMNLWDLQLDGDERIELAVADGFNTALVVLQGALLVNEKDVLTSAQLAVFQPKGDFIRLDRAQAAKALLLSGEPIDEPIVGQGPFVMNSTEEIRQAHLDFRSGKMGVLA
ncbi:MAG: pirin family protein [Planctomycetes bacterium]|nr:pirin family protein [Planctomycetota bacterium]